MDIFKENLKPRTYLNSLVSTVFSTVPLQMPIHVDKDEPSGCLENLACFWKVNQGGKLMILL